MRFTRLVPSLLIAVAAWGSDEPLPFPDMAPTIGKYLESNYYDPTRCKPRVMVERALRALETSEVSIDTRWANERITVVIKDAKTDIPAPEPATLDQAMELIEAVRKVVDAGPFTTIRRRDLDYALVNGALLSLDPHTVLMPPEPAREFGDSISGEFFGIGAWLTQDEGVIAIDRVMPGLPAERAGVDDGDVILAIDGEKTAGLSLDQAVKRIKGPKGTTVTLTLERRSANRTLDLGITRDLVQIITMRSYRRNDIGYVRMDEFNANTARDLRSAIDELLHGGDLKALVLDLRFNGGGLLDQAKLVSDLFLARGQEIVRTVTIDGEPTITKSSARNTYQVPLAVLTSGGSASAAEILSGALQRNDRAAVFGTTTFGKGSVQTIRPLRDGSRLKLTIQEYQLPGGVSIQDVGVNPDIALVRHALKKDGTLDRLRPYSREREVDDEFALGNHAAYRHDGSYELGWVAAFKTKDELKQSGISAREFAPDQEASLVLDLLAEASTAPTWAAESADALKNGQVRQFLLKDLAQPVKARAEKEAQTLAGILAKQDPPVTWGDAAAPAAGTLKLAYTGTPEITASGIDQAALADLSFTVTNTGKEPIGRLYGTVQADKFSPLWESEVLFGTVAPGATITGTLRFQVPPRIFSGEERFALDLHSEANDAAITTLPVTLAMRAQARPHFGLDWQIKDPAELKPGTQSFVQIVVTNDGAGPAALPTTRVFKSDDPFVQLGDSRFEYNKDGKRAHLAAGASWEFSVPVTISENIKGQPFKADHISLQVTCQETFGEDSSIDSRYRTGLFTTLKIPVGEKLKPHSIHAPQVTLASVERLPNDQAAVNVTVDDKDNNLQFITVFQDEDKVDLRTIGDLRSFRFPLSLKPGTNSIRVVVTDADEVDQVLPIRLWGEAQPKTAKTPTVAPAAPTNNVP